MTTVYVVTAGSYSDYRICSVWDNPQDAEREAAKFGTGWDSALVEEYVVNNSNTPHPPVWEATLSENGTISVGDKAVPAYEIGDIRSEVWPRRDGTLMGYSFGVSPDIAKKNLIDAVAKYKAEKDSL